MIQKARSRLDRVRRKRRPTVAARTAKVAPAATGSRGQRHAHPDGHGGQHRTAGEQRDHPDARLVEADERVGGRRPERQSQRQLPRATTTVLTYGRRVSLLRSTKMYRQASRDGWKSTNGR